MSFYIKGTKNILGKQKDVYYVSSRRWTLDFEDKRLFSTEHEANSAKSLESIQGTVFSI